MPPPPLPPHTHSPGQHGVQKHPQAPDINGSVIALFLEHFRRHKVGRVAGRHEEAILSAKLFSETKVCNAEKRGLCPRLGVEHVGRLQVTMDHPLLVKVVYCGGLWGEEGEGGGEDGEGRREG